MPRQTAEHDVVVVGAGPAGLVAGITLARYGIKVLVAEKRQKLSDLSRALVISTRCMEIFRRWGLEEPIRAGAADVESRAWVAPTLASTEGREMPLGYPTRAEAAKISPTAPAWAPQDHVEPILVDLLGSQAHAEVRFDCPVVGLVAEDSHVRVLLGARAEGAEEVAARFVIGADGAHSAVRAAVGVAMQGPDELAEYHRVEFRAPLGTVVADRRYGLYVLTNPDASGVLAPRGRHERWGLSREWHPGDPRMSDYEPAQLVALVAAAIGADVPTDIERVSSFSFAAQLAERYRAGRVFLVGDAAHRMTPRGGTGMNTAIQDAYDIGWKLAWTLRGWCDDRLLDTYEAERRPVGAHNVQRAARADGARRDVEDALPWDLNGRVTHHWLPGAPAARSTLDLIGDGLTLLAGPAGTGWGSGTRLLDCSAPVGLHVLDPVACSDIGIPPTGALLLRPDGHRVASWPGPEPPPTRVM